MVCSSLQARLSLLTTFSTAPAGKCRCRSLPLTRLCPSNPSRSAWLLRIYNSWINSVFFSLAQYQCGMAGLSIWNKTWSRKAQALQIPAWPIQAEVWVRSYQIIANEEKRQWRWQWLYNTQKIWANNYESLPDRSTSTCPPECLELAPCLPPPPSPGCGLSNFGKYELSPSSPCLPVSHSKK